MVKFPLIVENRLYEMDIHQREVFMDEYSRRRKSVFIGYVLLIPLGWHYAYVKRWGTQILCWLTFWGLFIWWLIDWFRIPSIVNRYNKDLAVKIMTEMSIIYGGTIRATIPETETELSVWLKQNSGKAINDYYAKFPIEREQVNVTDNLILQRPNQNEVRTNRSLITSAIVCGIGFIGYFSPWFKDFSSTDSYSGHEFIQLVDFQMHHSQEYRGVSDYIYIFYLIPISYIIIVLGAAARSYILTGLGSVINILVVGVFMKLIFNLQPEKFTFYIGFGFYLIIASILGVIYNACTLKFEQTN